MDAIRIRATRKLQGRIPVSGAKNAALPSARAALLSDGESLLHHHLDRGYQAIEKKLAQAGADIARIKIADEDR